MITGPGIRDLVKLLDFRNAFLYHACQYQDLLSYLRLGGIPSRQLLQSTNGAFTTFETDGNDQLNGVWDKVFVNLQDFGKMFGDGVDPIPSRAVPNVYGPVLLCIWPEALCEAKDVAVCLRSAGARDFNREATALRTVVEIDGLFRFPPDQSFPFAREVKRKDDLCIAYSHYPTGGNPEVSCTFDGGLLPLKYVGRIVVDPYTFGQRPLRESVASVLDRASQKAHVQSRALECDSRSGLYVELGRIVQEHGASLSTLQTDATVSAILRTWALSLNSLEAEYRQYTRFATYLREGTIVPILRSKVA